MRGLLAGRMQSVASLVAEVAEASGRVPMHAMEWSGGLRAVGGGMEAPPRAGRDRAWQDGTEVARVASACAGMSMGYVGEANLLVDDIAGYRAILPMETPLSVALRPMPPDCFAAADLVPKLRALDDAEVAWADFYHYGFMRLSNPLDRQRQEGHDMTPPAQSRFADTPMLVTGGASGIGRATVERAAAEGAAVAIPDKNGAAASALPMPSSQQDTRWSPWLPMSPTRSRSRGRSRRRRRGWGRSVSWSTMPAARRPRRSRPPTRRAGGPSSTLTSRARGW